MTKIKIFLVKKKKCQTWVKKRKKNLNEKKIIIKYRWVKLWKIIVIIIIIRIIIIRKMMLKKRIKFSHILVEIIKSIEILSLIRASKFCWLPCFKYLGLRTPRPNLCYFFPNFIMFWWNCSILHRGLCKSTKTKESKLNILIIKAVLTSNLKCSYTC